MAPMMTSEMPQPTAPHSSSLRRPMWSMKKTAGRVKTWRVRFKSAKEAEWQIRGGRERTVLVIPYTPVAKRDEVFGSRPSWAKMVGA